MAQKPKRLKAIKRLNLSVLEQRYDIKSSSVINGYLLSLFKTCRTTPQVPKSPPLVKRLLGAMKGEMNREDLQRNLNLRDRKSFRESYLAPALHGNL